MTFQDLSSPCPAAPPLSSTSASFSMENPILQQRQLRFRELDPSWTWDGMRQISRSFDPKTAQEMGMGIYIHIYIWARSPDPHTPPQWYPPPLLTPPPPQNLVFACYLHIYIHIYTYILPFPPLHPRISTLFAALESHDLVNGPCLPVYFYHNLFFEPPIACLAHGLQHICYLWITQSLPMQT